MKNNKKKITLIIIGVFLLIAAALGITYAYFLGKIGPNKTVNITSTSNTTDELTFDTGGILRINPNQQNAATPGNNISATTTASAKLVANNNTNNASYNYFLYLDITSNNYVYTTGITATPELVLTVTNPAGQEVTSIPGLTHVASPVSGFDVTTKTGLIRISENNPITATSTPTTQNWTFKLTFVNLATNQKQNSNKTFTSTLKIYKDKIQPTFAETLIENSVTLGMDYHSGLANGANDGSYRFSGANPNNYVCFGPGATAAGTACPEENQYRIIGVFGNQVKLIKKTSLGNKVWNSSNVNTWAGSTMDTYLNGEYLNSLTSTWSNKIASNTWQVGGMTGANGYNAVPATAYNYESGPNKANETFNGKIGLMYVADYGFAASPSNWTLTLYNYDNANAKANNWLFAGSIHSHEWTMSRYSDYGDYVFFVDSRGHVSNYRADSSWAVRPSFSLESFINLNGGNGTAIDPYRI